MYASILDSHVLSAFVCKVMTSGLQSDLYINLPALHKLDNMLCEILDSFRNIEFWYVDQGILAPESDGTSSFRNPLSHQEEKWWLPVPKFSPECLLDYLDLSSEHHAYEIANRVEA